MAAASTNGKGNGEDVSSGEAARSTHESAPGDRSEKSDPDLDVLSRGSTLGRYLVLERLGAGAMGVVYAAYDPELDRKVALKLLRHRGGGDEERRRARLVREAKAIAKVSHPNVVGIFDVGVHQGQVFLAMEYLAGGTLRDWLAAEKRPWREIVAMFIEVGKGLGGAHAEGLIHRDFKPDNVLVDKNGVPKVVDFGLVRLSAKLDASVSDSLADPDLAVPEMAPPTVSQVGVAVLTRTGALAGTPAYMAPEQFLGKPIDARTDQFAFCVALYEALFGERPFAGNNVITLADEVTSGHVREIAKNVDVPGWVRACVVRGLRTDPALRHASIDELLAALTNDPIVRRRRRLLIGLSATVVIAGVMTTQQLFAAKRREIDRQVSEHLAIATSSLDEAGRKRAEAAKMRELALTAFDGFEGTRGEELWAQTLDLAKSARADYQRGIQHLEAAATLSPNRDLKNRTADALAEYLGLDGLSATEREANLKDLAAYDDGAWRKRRLQAPAHLGIQTSPPGLDVRIEMYEAATYRLIPLSNAAGRTPLRQDLAPGSYRVLFDGTVTRAPFKYPILLAAGEAIDVSIPVPMRPAVPQGFVYVPQGRFLFGSADEEIRAFLETVPLHAVATKAFLMSKYETTIGEWISFLDELPPREMAERRPHGRKDALAGFIDIQRSAGGPWEIQFRATNKIYRAKEGEPFRYEDRSRRVSQDWSRFPVTGVSPEDAEKYAAWLDRTGRVPGARLCSELEWERAARGADGRGFPHGDRLLPEEANFDLTYGRKNGAYGPDEVGSHPASLSPFGVFDMVGNVWDITSSVLDKGQFVARGASFYQNRRTLLSSNRDPLSSVIRDHTIGVRICADARL